MMTAVVVEEWVAAAEAGRERRGYWIHIRSAAQVALAAAAAAAAAAAGDIVGDSILLAAVVVAPGERAVAAYILPAVVVGASARGTD